MNLFIRKDYTHNLQPKPYEDEGFEGTRWQEDVYRLAKLLCTDTVIDVGCGKGHKLIENGFFNGKVIGLDGHDVNLNYCIEKNPDSTWLKRDFEHDNWAKDISGDVTGATVICADVIEHLVDPFPLLQNLKECFDTGAKYIIISTPEREISKGKQHLGPPPNVCHVREWSIVEFENLLNSVGLSPNMLLLTKRNNKTNQRGTILAIIWKQQQ